jgi:cytochrome c-type biogenesis protein
MELNVFISFLAGLLSFLSPCVLAIAPAYVSYIMEWNLLNKKKLNINPYPSFCYSFSGVFILMGLGASFFGECSYSLPGVV